MKKIIAISGSLRKNSHNTHLLHAAHTLVPVGLFYNYDIEINQGIPSAVITLKNKIIAADALLLSTPEYNNGIPGVMKNTIDWLSRPPADIPEIFHNRKVGLIGAGASRFGTAFAQTAWLPIFRFLNMNTYFEKSLYISNLSDFFSENGQLIDAKIRKLLQQYSVKFRIVMLFVAATVYTHYRGKLRYGFWRQLSDHSTFFAPINVFMYLFSAVPTKPYLPLSHFPELQTLQDNWQKICDEASRLNQTSNIKAADGYTDADFNSFFRRGWKRFYIKWYQAAHP